MHRRLTSQLTTIALACTVAVPLAGQKITDMGTGGGGSPHVKAEWTVDGAAIAIEYGRPSLKGRPEAQMMPAGKPWRTGADQATVIKSDKPLTFGSVKLEANTPYTINTVPARSSGSWSSASSISPGSGASRISPRSSLARIR